MKKNFVFELGVEELPATVCEQAIEQMQSACTKLFAENNLVYSGFDVYATPRRLVVHINELAQVQKDSEVDLKGPPLNQAYKDGSPTQALLGFCKSKNIDIADTYTVDYPNGQFVHGKQKIVGQKVDAILPGIILEGIKKLSFARMMRLDSDFKFSRPLKWIFCMHGEKVVPVEFEGMSSSNVTYGHRLLSPASITVFSADTYFTQLKEAYVIVSQVEREKTISDAIEKLASQMNVVPLSNEGLLNELVYITEYPSLIVGSFDKAFLQVPAEVLVTVMQSHQRYLPLSSKNGKLTNEFIIVSNGDPDKADIIRQGNERVLRARLSDAQFFYAEDCKIKLEERFDKLNNIVYQEELGSVADKVFRVSTLANAIAEILALDPKTIEQINSVAALSKNDLTTQVVMEFTELQGIMGEKYALLDGYEPVVARGIREYYLPKASSDPIPADVVGQIVALSDKLDTLVGCFGVGIIPTGSADQYGLRRATIGIIRIILESRLELDIQELINLALENFKKGRRLKNGIRGTRDLVMDFVFQRFRNILLDDNISYDIADASLGVSTPLENIHKVYATAITLTEKRKEKKFEDFWQALTRCIRLTQNIDKFSHVSEKLFEDSSEGELYKEFKAVEAKINRDMSIKDSIEEFYRLTAPINKFFDNVMVMVDDQKVRANRLNLLNEIVCLSKIIADFSKIIKG